MRPLEIRSPEALDYIMWDRTVLQKGVTRLFAESLGHSVEKIRDGKNLIGVKSYVETNMENSGVIPIRQIRINSIVINLIAEKFIEHEYLNIIDNCTFDWKIIDQRILMFPLNVSKIRQVSRKVEEVVNSDDEIVQNKGFELKVPITLNPYENFRVDIINNLYFELSQPYAIQVSFVGTCRRPF